MEWLFWFALWSNVGPTIEDRTRLRIGSESHACNCAASSSPLRISSRFLGYCREFGLSPVTGSEPTPKPSRRPARFNLARGVGPELWGFDLIRTVWKGSVETTSTELVRHLGPGPWTCVQWPGQSTSHLEGRLVGPTWLRGVPRSPVLDLIDGPIGRTCTTVVHMHL